MNSLKRLWKEEEAATATEYGIIAAILAVGLIAVLILFRNRLVGMFSKAANAVGS